MKDPATDVKRQSGQIIEIPYRLYQELPADDFLYGKTQEFFPDLWEEEE